MRVSYLKKEFRDQTANFLARRYDILLLPKHQGHDHHRLTPTDNQGCAPDALTMSHSMIFSHLKEKCTEYNSTFMLVKEHYTSQRVGGLEEFGGLMRQALGVKKCNGVDRTYTPGLAVDQPPLAAAAAAAPRRCRRRSPGRGFQRGLAPFRGVSKGACPL